MKKFDISVSVYLTWSKLIAFIILILAFILDYANNKAGTVFMFSIPFVVFLISGKQYFDRGKPDPESTEKIINATIEKNKIEAENG